MLTILLALVAANPALAEEAEMPKMSDCKRLPTEGERAACRVAVASRAESEAMADQLEDRFARSERERKEKEVADTATLQALTDSQAEIDSSQDEKIAAIDAKVAAVAAAPAEVAPSAPAPVALPPMPVVEQVAMTGAAPRIGSLQPGVDAPIKVGSVMTIYGVSKVNGLAGDGYACVEVDAWVPVARGDWIALDLSGTGSHAIPMQCAPAWTSELQVVNAKGKVVTVYYVEADTLDGPYTKVVSMQYKCTDTACRVAASFPRFDK